MPTAVDGGYAVEGLAPGPWTPLAAAEGCVETLGETVELADGEEKSGADVVLPAAREIAGRVVDAAGAPVPGARISAGPLSSWPPQEGAVSAVASYVDQPTARSNADGRFVLAGLGPGTCRVSAGAEECAPWSGNVEAGATDLVVVLAAGLRIEGVAREKAGGKPVAGIKLYGSGKDGTGGEAWTAADGTFTLRGLAEGTYSVNFYSSSEDRWAPLSVWGITAGTKGLVLEMQEGQFVSGRCVDASGGPFDARNLRVGCIGPEGGDVKNLGADGQFLFDHLVPGPCRLSVYSSTSRGVGVYVARTMDVQVGDRNVVFALTRGKSITGRVMTAEGGPPGTRVSLFACPAGSGGVGGVSTENGVLEDGSFCTDPFADGAAQDLIVQTDLSEQYAIQRDVLPGSEGVVLRLERALSITGRVEYPAGLESKGTAVFAFPVAGLRRCYYAEVRPDRTFTFANVPKGGYRLFARSFESNVAPVEDAAVVQGGDTGVVVKAAAGHELRVRIRRSDGSPLAQGDFPALDHSFGGRPETLGLYLEDDVYRMRGLPAGPVTLRIANRLAWSRPGEGILATLELPCQEQTLTVPR
jgi:hypothetical protein